MNTLPNLHQFTNVKHHLKCKLEKELDVLEERVRQLQGSSSKNREIIITTYRKIIDRKQDFKKHWDL
ncbi:MAG: hypothetical protein H7A01_11315 [Hahellaceae bacterium]|jgi:hypothetical protein|nr:hypothetical protein [Hahellaceae bacterium]MCP5210095.1 hypothetical protein [Hahellaceae bacterium]